jgi:SWIM zinc finger
VGEGKRIFQVESFTTPGIRYEIDLDRRTCSCLAFQKHPSRPCKHLLSIDGLFPQSAEADPSEALSAFIKSIRLRRIGDALVWLLYLWRVPQFQTRIQRRILIAAAEDNLSVGVIESAAGWYHSIARLDFEDAVREVCRICATANWWAQPTGHAYIFAWLKAEKLADPEPGSDFLSLLKERVQQRDVLGALKTFGALYASGQLVPKRLADVLQELAFRSGCVQAVRLAELYQANLRPLGMDANVSGQALYAALIGEFGDQGVPTVDNDKVLELIDEARQRLTGKPEIPNWALDGIQLVDIGTGVSPARYA